MKALAVIGILLAVLAIAAGWSYQSQRRALRELEARLLRSQEPGVTAGASFDDAPLPPPVSRYLHLALGEGRAHPETVAIHQSGELRTDEMSERWMPFTATHMASPRACGFIWNARIRLAPLMHLRVLDSLVDGQGSGQVIFESLIPVARDAGTPEINSGALHRFLAEAVWYPNCWTHHRARSWNPLSAKHRASPSLVCRTPPICPVFAASSPILVSAPLRSATQTTSSSRRISPQVTDPESLSFSGTSPKNLARDVNAWSIRAAFDPTLP